MTSLSYSTYVTASSFFIFNNFGNKNENKSNKFEEKFFIFRDHFEASLLDRIKMTENRSSE